jgi:hypothetical protein
METANTPAEQKRIAIIYSPATKKNTMNKCRAKTLNMDDFNVTLLMT